jgi:2-aminoadipate transaminase
VDTKKVEAAALQEGIAYNPGCEWAADPEAATNYLRLCFALPSDELIEEGIAKLAQVFHREAGVP